MIDSDITGNIAECRQLTQKQEMIESHEAGCECDCCCGLSESDCQDNLAQCSETQQPSERRKKMKGKLIPALVNSALLLTVIGLSNTITNARNIRGAAINIKAASETRIGNISLDSVAIVIDDISESTAAVIADAVIENADIDPLDVSIVADTQLSVTDFSEQIAEPLDKNARLDIERVLLPVVADVEYTHTIALVNSDILPEIRS
jgi:hypothetical protein